MDSAFWREHVKKNATAYTEMNNPLGDGRWFHVATSPFKDGRFVTSFFDMTEQKRTEPSCARPSSATAF